MDFLWHRKGDKPSQGPQGLQFKWKEQGFCATQAVVLELVTRMRNSGQNHIIWLDNLFTSARLLATLREMGIGAAGTVRTGQTAREKKTSKNQTIPQDIHPIDVIDTTTLIDSLELDISRQLSGSTQGQLTVSTSSLDTRLVELKTRFRNLLE